MTSAFSARRRADEFEALLTRTPGAPLTDREAARFASPPAGRDTCWSMRFMIGARRQPHQAETDRARSLTNGLSPVTL